MKSSNIFTFLGGMVFLALFIHFVKYTSPGREFLLAYLGVSNGSEDFMKEHRSRSCNKSNNERNLHDMSECLETFSIRYQVCICGSN